MTSDEYVEKLLKNTIEEEREKVIRLVCKLGPKLSGLMLTCGLLVLIVGIYFGIVPQDPSLSPRLNIIFIGALSFLGVLNILCGLLLLLGED